MNETIDTFAEHLLESGLQLASCGIPTFPCNFNKAPLIKDGFKAATIDIERIKAWRRRWPHAMIGIPTGWVSGLLVLDIDVKNGKNGFNELAKLGLDIHCGGLEAKTPSGGSHFYFEMPESIDVRCSSDQIAPGVDVRANGGYVIAPPPGSPRICRRIAGSTAA